MKKCYIYPKKSDELFFEINGIRTDFISEKNYEDDMTELVEPYLKERRKYGYFKGKENIDIYYEEFLNNNCTANIVISHGFGESTEKYYEFIYYLIKNNYNVFIMEHRGNCRSQRLGIDNSQLNVESFEYYIEDFKKFIDEIVIADSQEKNLMLFAHSMGGAIGTAFLEKYPKYFKSAILSSPMHEINTGRVPRVAAKLIINILKFLKKDNSYVPGKTPYKEEFRLQATNSVARYKYYRRKVVNNKEYQIGGPSVNWFYESTKAQKKFLKKENAAKIKIPVLLIQAECDTYVMPKAHYRFAENAGKCLIAYIKEAKHESYYETDNIALAVLEKILGFFYETL